jgi:hypothetical protein
MYMVIGNSTTGQTTYQDSSVVKIILHSVFIHDNLMFILYTLMIILEGLKHAEFLMF